MIKQYERILGSMGALQAAQVDSITEEATHHEESRYQKRRVSQQGVIRGNALTEALVSRRVDPVHKDLLVKSQLVQGVYSEKRSAPIE